MNKDNKERRAWLDNYLIKMISKLNRARLSYKQDISEPASAAFTVFKSLSFRLREAVTESHTK